MKLIDSSPTLAKRIVLKGIKKFRKAYKVPRPKRIKPPDTPGATHVIHVAAYEWPNIFNKSCEVWVMTDEFETKWNCIVSDGGHRNVMLDFSPRTEEWEMAQAVAECLELWFNTNVRAP